MADDVVSWEFKLLDQVSNNASKVERSLQRTDASLKKASSSFTKLDLIAVNVLSHIGSELKQFGENLLDTRRWKEETLIGLRAVTGTAAAARAAFDGAERLAIAMGQPTKEIVDAAKRMLTAGYSLEDAKVFSTVLSDVKLLNGAAAMDTVADALSKMGTSGKVTERTMLALNSVAGLGGRVSDVLTKKLHVTSHELKEMIAAGRIPKDWGAYAIAEGVRQLEGGKLGNVTKEVAQTFGGLMTSIKDELFAIFEGDGSGLSEGMRRPLEAIKELLAPGSPFLVGVKAGLNELAEGFGIVGGGDGISKWLESLKDGTALGDDFKHTMRGLGEDLRNVVDLLGMMASGIASVAGALNTIRHTGNDLQDVKASKATGWDHPLDAISGMPDALMKGISRNDLKAFGIPGLAEGGIVNSPTLALIGEAGPEAVVPLGSGGGARGRGGGIQGGIHINVNVHHGGGAGGTSTPSDGDPNALADNIGDVILERLNSALEDLAMEGGIG